MLLLVESVPPTPDRYVDAVVRDDAAFVESVFDRVLDGDIERIALELGRLEAAHELQRGLRESQCLGQGFPKAAIWVRDGVWEKPPTRIETGWMARPPMSFIRSLPVRFKRSACSTTGL